MDWKLNFIGRRGGDLSLLVFRMAMGGLMLLHGIGKLMDLFHFQEEAPGLVFWHDKGWQIYEVIRNYIRAQLRDNGYQEVNTPQIVDRSLWEQSGHWDKFRENMFTTGDEEQRAPDHADETRN